jgi:hypothetical protein
MYFPTKRLRTGSYPAEQKLNITQERGVLLHGIL